MEMEKEILSIKLIQYELRQRVRGSLIGAVIFLPLSLLLMWPTVKAIIAMDFYYRILLLLVFPVCFFILAISLLCDAYRSHSLVENPQQVLVKDRLVDMKREEITCGRTRPHGIFWHLYFENYGEYVIGEEEYLWSDLYWRYKAEDVYCSSAIGDEFYLVLSKPHKGRVNYIYNTKLFEFQ